MKVTWAGFSLISGVLACGIYSTSVNAQVIPDATLKTTVLENGNNFTITDGNRVGNNLFHSFSQFSIPSKGSAFFNNASDIQNIFSRVTGGSVSNIDGLIKANGSANLFLLNPSGIIFGQNASLNIGGSFVGTTAESLLFADGSKFSATNPVDSPLLTISVPVGLQIGSKSSSINVNGAKLAIPAKNTFALVGNNLTFDKSTITASDSRVELGSVAANNIVGLSTNTAGFNLDYNAVTQFQNMNFSNAAKIDASGKQGGAIVLQGQKITLSDSSTITSHTSGTSSGQGILVKASDSLEIIGRAALSNTGIAADSQVNATGRGGDITIEAPIVNILNGAQINTRTHGIGDSGNIAVKSTTVNVIGEAIHVPTRLRFSASTIASNTMNGSKGGGGNVTVDATQVNIRNGAELRSSARGTGDGGNIIVTAKNLNVTGETATNEPAFLTGMSTSIRENATGRGGDIILNVEKLEVLNGPGIRTGTYGEGISGDIIVNANEVTLAGSSSAGVSTRFFASTNGNYDVVTTKLISLGKGQGGNIFLNTAKLNLLDGGRISTSTETYGQAGNISIQANIINIAGVSQVPSGQLRYTLDATGPSGLSASSTGPGTAGSVYVTTQDLSLSDRGEIVVSGLGSGDAGNMLIQSNRINLDLASKLRSESNAVEGGNIDLQVRDVLLMRRGSFISAEAGGTGNGGNITINAPNIIGLENSDIIANAVKGRGGNIQIATQGIIGLEYRNLLNPIEVSSNDITASSKYNVNGTVQINNVGIDPNSGLIELPENVTDSSQQIVSGCSENQGSSFVATGRGGIPQNPSLDVRSDTSGGLYSLRTWSDIRDISAYRKTQPVQAKIPQTPETLVQATGWYRNAQGKIELVADKSSTPAQQLSCAAVSR
ncbi:filamentous hemagglutinin N-terminal domain-containing protein [Calothrix sp. PCC 6303]|uniref:two-partner secretion domain-containing protein n=1 Tax=Calothrix sp. PCC 6303 TaxID=1170562 RepID=UPI0002A048FE|nr:S-layer family protein [Calothrix sp. PCC 6303]AFZ02490.1 filamentous hemagglutinin family outer membrane protein [Calothrix sp. PCC 6303]